MSPTLTVGAEIAVSGASSEEIARLRSACAIPNPEYQNLVKLGKSVVGVPPTLYFCRETGPGEMRLPRGQVGFVRETWPRVPFVDLRETGTPLTCPVPDGLRYYQRDAVDLLVSQLQGSVILPCGTGKTTLGLAAIAAIGRSALVLVHTSDLASQWQESCRELLGIEPAMFGGATKDMGPLTIATMQSLVRYRGPLDQFGVVIADECHKVSCATLQSILARCPAKWRLGLTATPDRDDGLGPAIEMTLGPRLLHKATKEMIDEGWLVRPVVKRVSTAFSWDVGGRPNAQWLAKMNKAIISDEARNSLVAELVDPSRATLVLSGRKAHCATLAGLIPDAKFITGSTPKKERESAIAMMRTGKLSCLVATSLADEGLDITRLDCLILAFPERAKGRTAQRIGRIMRRDDTKQNPIVFDLVDNVGVLLSRWISRKSVYLKAGLSVEERK